MITLPVIAFSKPGVGNLPFVVLEGAFALANVETLRWLLARYR
jgi:hypothetical protein